MPASKADQRTIEFVALSLLESTNQPVGAARLAAAWNAAGLVKAEATAGRYLRSLDERGLTTLLRATRGRVLTEAGKALLSDHEGRRRREEYDSQLWKAVNATDIADLMDLLRMRELVETESARIAATRATNEELELLVDNAPDHIAQLADNGETTAPSMSFHRLVSRMSHNRILAAVAELLLDPVNDPLERMLEQISADAGVTLGQVSDHLELAHAIQRRDAEEAEQIMRRHMRKLIQAVEDFQHQQAGVVGPDGSSSHG